MTNLEKARAVLERWRLDPASMVREEFNVEPDAFQLEGLAAFADPKVNRIALKSCKGPGKTALEAWCGMNFLATRGRNTRIGATSITEGNIDMNLWPELSKWQQRSEFFSTAFVWTKTRFHSRTSPETCFMEKRTWPKKATAEQQADALAGLHDEHVMWIADESGGMPQALMVTMEAILATQGQEGKILQAGNPTHTTGPLHRACTTDRHLWYVITITGDPENPKRSPRIDLEWARQQIKSYGRDNPWVKVNVLGEFPEASINALLGVEEVNASMLRHYPVTAYEWAQKRLGVDVARFGDDRTVIFPRQGLAAFRPIVMRGAKTTAIAGKVAKGIADWGAELTIVDDTGHWGHGVVDNLTDSGFAVLPIVYSDPALNPRYRNRRVEMWLGMADWVKAGGALPNIPEMVPELTEPTYTFIGGKFVLEDKDQIKERLGRSPDLADALAQTFALAEMPAKMMTRHRKSDSASRDFDPNVLGQFSSASRDFDPNA